VIRKLRIFLSSVQKEFAGERTALRDFITRDPMLGRFFEVFLFEDLPAKDQKADSLYLEEVRRCAVYLALLGNQYGREDAKGISATHREFMEASAKKKHRIVLVKGLSDAKRQPKIMALINQAGDQVIRRRFEIVPELISYAYASLVDYLASKELLRSGPFDAAVPEGSSLKDLSAEKIRSFIRLARTGRGFPLSPDAPMEKVLEHLNLLSQGRPTYAALMLFGKVPQRFLIPSEVKCAHFHGTEAVKPIPFYQVYKGTAFELVDQAVNFVLSKINLAVGTRARGTQAPVKYELPPEVVREAIVNAVAHRDYTSNGSVQVMLFSDRLEVWNPGTLPPSLTLETLRRPHGSVPGNPLLAEPLYLAKYIERMGTGTGDMINLCKKAGLPEPEFLLTDGFVTRIRPKPELAFKAVGGKTGAVAGQVTGKRDQVGTKSGLSRDQVAILSNCAEPKSLAEILALAGRSNRTKFRDQVVNPLLRQGLLEMTIPDKPKSRLQQYRLTRQGKTVLKGLKS